MFYSVYSIPHKTLTPIPPPDPPPFPLWLSQSYYVTLILSSTFLKKSYTKIRKNTYLLKSFIEKYHNNIKTTKRV